jgi:predicted PurR-regulated permease PerM
MGVSTLGVNARQLTGDELLGARLSPLARLLVIAASVIIILAGLKAAAEIAAPILFAIFLATLASPLLQGLENRGLSTARALAVMIAGTLALGGDFVALIYLSVRQILILPSAANAGALGAARLERRARRSRASDLTELWNRRISSATGSCCKRSVLSCTPSAVRSCNWSS